MNGYLDGFDVHAEFQLYQNAVMLYMGNRTTRVMPWIATIVQYNEIDQASVQPRMEPTFTLSRPQATTMLDALWKVGIRPPGVSNESDVVNHLKAHIADLREELKRSHTVIRELNHILAERALPGEE